MAVGTATAVGIGLGAAGLGAAAGAMGNKSDGNWSSNISMGPSSDLENFLAGTPATPGTGASPASAAGFLTNKGATGAIPAKPGTPGYLMQNFKDLQGLVASGPGQQDVTNSYQATNDLASMLKAYSEQGGNLPTDQDISGANSFASTLFRPQQEALDQSFTDQTTAANRQAALLGRSVNDPILQAKLRTEQMRQSRMLQANQGAFAQQYALQQPMQRLGFAEHRANILGGLATQAMANRQALSALGTNLLTNDRAFRINSANRSGNQQTQSGGGFAGGIMGGLAGLGAGMSVAGMAMGSGGVPSSGAASGAAASSLTPTSAGPISGRYYNPFSGI